MTERKHKQMRALVNDKAIGYDDSSDMLRDILMFHLPHVQYQDRSHAADNMKEQLLQFSEFLELEYNATKKAGRNRVRALIKKIHSFTKVLDFCKSNGAIQIQIYNLVLSLEKLGLLHGFGMSNIWGDKLKGDPERKSLYVAQQLFEKYDTIKIKNRNQREVIMEVNFKDLRAAVVNLNQSKLIKKSIPLVALPKEKIYEQFMEAMEQIEDDPETKNFPTGAEIALEYFNKMVDIEKKEEKQEMTKKIEAAKPEAKKAKANGKTNGKVKADAKADTKADAKAKKPGKETKVKEPKPKKEKVAKEQVTKNKYGHRDGSQAALIDTAFEKGGTFESFAKELKLTESRIKSHYHHMVKEKGIKFVEKGDIVQIKKSQG